MNKHIKSCGIVAEYNPFHNGHRYHIEQARIKSGCDVVVAIMSGNFVQRGEPAIIDKWKRAKAAIRNGVDVVIELPYIYATQSASGFAHGAMEIAKKAKIDAICFGSECGNIDNLLEIAETSVNPDHLREMMNNGLSYPKSYSLLTSSMAPNDILGISYLKEIHGTDIEPYVIQRTNGYLDEDIEETASAFAIRKALMNETPITGSTPMENILLQSERNDIAAFYPYLRTYLMMSKPEDLHNIFLFNEGIEYHLIKNAVANPTFEEFLNASVTYRYTASRIRRTILQAMMQLTKSEHKEAAKDLSIRILAFNDNGRNWLKQLKQQEIPYASKFPQIAKNQREIEYRAAMLYGSTLSEQEKKRILQEEIRGARYFRSE